MNWLLICFRLKMKKNDVCWCKNYIVPWMCIVWLLPWSRYTRISLCFRFLYLLACLFICLLSKMWPKQRVWHVCCCDMSSQGGSNNNTRQMLCKFHFISSFSPSYHSFTFRSMAAILFHSANWFSHTISEKKEQSS